MFAIVETKNPKLSYVIMRTVLFDTEQEAKESEEFKKCVKPILIEIDDA